MFIPGDTVVHEFTIPFNREDIIQIMVSYKQGDRIVYEKNINSQSNDVYYTEGQGYTKISYNLEQQTTLLFADNYPYTIQLSVYTDGGGRLTSQEVKSHTGIQYVRRLLPEGGTQS